VKTPRLRPQAERDLVITAQFYGQEGGEALARRFFDAAIAALTVVAERPAIGSPRLGQLCDIPGLRSWAIKDFPTVWLYIERSEHLDVVRLLDKRQDIAATLADDS
jgi:toxin ParE1/3/4